MDIAQFREHFPAFSDELSYPDPMVEFWSGLAEKLLIQTRWGGLWSTGVELYTAHQLTLEKVEMDAATSGGAPSVSIVSSESVGDVSVSYDTAGSLERDAGHYNATSYGRRFYRLMLIAGMGGVQLSGMGIND